MEFFSVKDVKEILKHDHVIKGRKVDCKPNLDQKAIKQDKRDVKERKIFVGNLNKFTTKSNLATP